MGDLDDARNLVRRARMLLSGAKGTKLLESLDLRNSLTEQLSASEARKVIDDLTVTVVAADVTAAASRAMEKADRGEESNLTDFELASLEAIVQLTGRPAMRYIDGRVELPPNGVGENDNWRNFVALANAKINAASASVGKVSGANADGTPSYGIGTAWRLGTDLVVTNRHVAEPLVRDSTLDPSRWKLDPEKPALVDFNATDHATTVTRFGVAELMYCAEEKAIDFAILRLDPKDKALPPALELDFDASSVGREVPVGGVPTFRGEEVYVVGHPYREVPSAASLQVFGNADASKRCSPGVVTAIARTYELEHDCSTLGGNSGSCVLTVSEHKVVGVHYRGIDLDVDTGRGSANSATALSRLGDHRAASILKEGRML